jgi:alpha-tubulin suppressor-like RCC1 family protein
MKRVAGRESLVFNLGLMAVVAAGCGTKAAPPATEAVRAALLSSAGLTLETSTASCAANQTQDFFEVINNSSAGVKVSDITVKFWIDDTSGNAVIPHVWTGGCLSDATGCFHQVSGVTAAATSFAPACGPDANHQANWEITVSNTDPTVLNPGVNWTNIQTALNLANFSNFVPGSGSWFSPCLTSSYTADNHFAVYVQGNLVFSTGNGIPTPSCRSPQGAQKPAVPLITPAIAAGTLVGPVPPNTTIDFAIGLAMNNPAGLEAIADQAANPHSPTYGQFLTDADIMATYAPSAADYQAITQFAQAKGFSVFKTYPNRLLLSLSGTAAQIEQAFFVNLNTYLRPDGSTFYAPDREPTFDFGSPVPIYYVSGLTDFFVEPSRPLDIAQVGGNGSGNDNNYLSRDLRRAYASCTNLDGTGQTVGLIAGAGYALSDVQKYESLNGITTATVPQNVMSGSTVSASVDSQNIIRSIETAGDIEMVKAMAPGAQPIVFLISSTISTSLGDILAMASPPHQISTSFTVAVGDPNTNNLLNLLNAKGVSFFYPTGDDGSYDGFNEALQFNPLGIPQFTTIGGTTLTMSNTAFAYSSESTWIGSGGGKVATVDLATGMESTSFDRQVPDFTIISTNVEGVISCGLDGNSAADCLKPPAAGHNVVNGTLTTLSGTSIASPLWAGFMALVNQRRSQNQLAALGPANPTLDAIAQSPQLYTKSLHDIADGSNNQNANPSQPLFTAVPGYDLASGWGTPRCRLITQLGEAAPTTPLTIALGRQAPDGCEIHANGELRCWGSNTFGEVGNGTQNQALSPVPVQGMSSGVAAVAVGEGGTICAAKQDGTVWCWGANDVGQLGIGTTTPPLTPPQTTPVQVPGLTNVTALAAGFEFTCALKSDGTIWCWGRNEMGQLGIGTSGVANNQSSPVQVPVVNNAVAIDASGQQACWLNAAGKVFCMGANEFGQLGDGTTTMRPSPVQANLGLAGVTAKGITMGEFHTCAIVDGDLVPGEVVCWGSNNARQLGDPGYGSQRTAGVPIVMDQTSNGRRVLGNVTSISAGAFHTCALRSESSLFCWGDNGTGALGSGVTGPVSSGFGFNVIGADYDYFMNPTNECANFATGCRQVLAAGSIAVTSGAGNTCALLSNGNAQCWGFNRDGNLGDGTTTNRLDPVPLPF